MLFFLGAYVAVTLARLSLTWLNLSYQQREGHRVPPELEGEINAERLAKISAYTVDKARFGLVQGAGIAALVAVGLFGGWLGSYDRWIGSFSLPFIGSGVAFLIGLMVLGALVSLPFELYSDFVVEARHGFNKKTPALWCSDWLKSTALSLAFGALLCAGALLLVQSAPHSWWLWVSALIGGFSVLLTFVSPYLIEPLFHRMEPLAEPELVSSVQALTRRAGVRLGRVLTVDASRRSSHSNAYFTGLGKVKRVVLFDTLLAQMTRAQVLAILAHELGHWKKRHVLRRMIVVQLLLTLAAYVAFELAGSELVPRLVGLSDASFPARIVVLSVLASVCLFPMVPLLSYWSRHDERQADQFAVDLHGQPLDLADALAKLGGENLSNLHPHPLFAAFYYSHPPLTTRIRDLRRLAGASTC